MRLKQFQGKGKLTLEKPAFQQTLKQAIMSFLSTPEIKTVKDMLSKEQIQVKETICGASEEQLNDTEKLKKQRNRENNQGE
jgi:hypothetical protein